MYYHEIYFGDCLSVDEGNGIITQSMLKKKSHSCSMTLKQGLKYILLDSK